MKVPPADTYEGQLAARAAELLPSVGLEERLELLAAMDPDETAGCLAWLASQHPQVFDHSIVRDRGLAGRLQERLDEADEDQEDDLEPYCSACGGKAGIFQGHGPGWRHYRGEGTVASPVELLELTDLDHAPEISWAPAGAR